MVGVLIYGLYGLVLLVVLWPVERSGRVLLRKWHVDEPEPEQVAEAVRYLKRRRLQYPVLYMLAGLVITNPDDWFQQLMITVFIGTLFAELVALRPRRDHRREALLRPRRLFDLVSPWALGGYTAFVLVSVLQILRDSAGLGRSVWPNQLLLGASVLVVAVITWAAVVRPSSGDARVDGALRTRSARVAIGLGAAIAGVLVPGNGMAAMVGVVLWVLIANAPVRVKLVDAP